MRIVLLIVTAMVTFIFTGTVSYGEGQGSAQADSSVYYAAQYGKSRITRLQQYDRKWEKEQRQLLRRLRKKESKILRLLAQKDSAAYKNYLQHRPGLDSLQQLTEQQANLSSLSRLPYPGLDKLKAAESLVHTQSGTLPAIPVSGSSAALDKVLSGRGILDHLIATRAQALQSLAGTHNIPGADKIKQTVYYARARISWLKEKADEPDEAEQQALAYLQGTKDFGSLLTSFRTGAFGGLGNNATEADLARLGYQTKSMVNSQVQQQLGDHTDAVLQQVGDNLASYTGPYAGYLKKASSLKSALPGYAEQVKAETAGIRSSARKAVQSAAAPGFRVNPQMCKPFWDRWSLQYNFQASRASSDGTRPAITEIGAAAVYQQNTWLSFSGGIAAGMGLGPGLSRLKLSYEGVSLRASVTGVWFYGMGLQGGYERYFIPVGRPYLATTANETGNAFTTALGSGGNVAYLGIVKQYRISNKWHGSFVLGYNFLWKESTGLRSPVMFRFAWSK